MAATPSLPRDLDALDERWLTSALSERSPGTTVTRIAAREVLHGSATKVLLTVEYDDPRAVPPAALCLKGGFDDAERAVGGMGFLTEARFFTDLAPRMPVPVPTCWYAGTEGRPTGQSIVILDDLRAHGARFGRPTAALDVDAAAATLDLMARWHAAYWGGRGTDGAPWLTVGSPVLRHVIDLLTSAEHFDRHMAMPKADPVPAALRDRDTVRSAMRRLWEHDDAAAPTLLHGDTHIGNMYFDADGAPAFLDWQSVMLGPWSHDVATFLAGALDVEDRRADERALLDEYAGRLAAHGGPALDRDAAWLDYRRHVMHGFLWVLTPEEMQPPEHTTAMAARYSAAAEDLDVLDALG